MTPGRAVAALVVALTAVGARVPAAQPPPAWTLVWADEFNADGPPDPRSWTSERGFVRNHEAQWYQGQNARCSHGLLVIEAKRERVRNSEYVAGSASWPSNQPFAEYTSASLMTKGLRQWQYGRFEMRGRIDTRAGMWPAWWTLGTSGEWPDGGEIDMMEFYRGMLLANVGWASGRRWVPTWDSVRTPVTQFGENWGQEFHVWRMDWDANWIRLFVDDRLLNETALAGTVDPARHTDPFHQPHYMLLNLAVGGDNGGDPSATAFPARVEVDYVRVYQSK